MYKSLRLKDGTKLYATCRWEENQHKIYNAYDRAMIRIYEAEESGDGIDEAYAWRNKVETALKWIDNVKDDGITYAPYDAYAIIKDLIGGYDARHH